MKSLLAALAVTTALTMPGLASARPVTLTTTLSQYGGDGAYLALYVTDPQGAYAGTLWMAGGKSKYYADLTDWYRATGGDPAEIDGITGVGQFFKIKLPLVLPAIGIISILTFVGNFNAFDLVYTMQGALAGPDKATDILGTFLYRTFFGFQLQLGDQSMGATIATIMFLIILTGVCIYLFGIQRRIRRYQF